MSDSISARGFEPLPATGDGADLFDGPSLFYLTHKEVIDEWAGLQAVAAKAANEWLSTVLPPRLEELAAAHGLTVSHTQVSEGESSVLLHPPNMPVYLDSPLLAIALGWFAHSVNPAVPALWVGIRVETALDRGAARELFLKEASGLVGPASGWKLKTENRWPTYRYLDGAGRWWTTLDAYREQIVREVSVATERFAGAVVQVGCRIRSN